MAKNNVIISRLKRSWHVLLLFEYRSEYVLQSQKNKAPNMPKAQRGEFPIRTLKKNNTLTRTHMRALVKFYGGTHLCDKYTRWEAK